MSKVGSWSTIAGNNNATPPDGWPEGQAPSTVNDCAREMMASIRTVVGSLEYIDLNNTPSFLTTTTFSLGNADVTNFEVGRRLKLFDTTTLYGTIISVSATLVQVRLDSGVLSTSLSSVGLAVVKATNNSLPDNVWKRKNLIINGAMDFWQRGVSFTSVATNTYTADRFLWEQSSTSANVNIGRLERSANASNVPTLAQAGVLLLNSMVVSVSATDGVIISADYAAITYRVEGYDWRQVAHKPLNLSFWCNTNKSGIYACSVRNGGASLSYVQNFTISAVNTWTKFSLQIPEAPTTQTWDYSSGIGLQVSWVLAAGGNFQQATASVWTVANLLATPSQVNFLASAGNTFALTGVQLEEGSWASPLEIRPYKIEKDLCTRYYQVFPSDPTKKLYLQVACGPTDPTQFVGQFEINEMRASPVASAGTASGVEFQVAAGGSATSTFLSATFQTQPEHIYFTFNINNVTGGSAGECAVLILSATATAAFRMTSEL